MNTEKFLKKYYKILTPTVLSRIVCYSDTLISGICKGRTNITEKQEEHIRTNFKIFLAELVDDFNSLPKL